MRRSRTVRGSSAPSWPAGGALFGLVVHDEMREALELRVMDEDGAW